MRELQNCLERAVILVDGDTIHPKHLNLHVEDFVAAGEPAGAISICRAASPTSPAARVDGGRASGDRAGAATMPTATWRAPPIGSWLKQLIED